MTPRSLERPANFAEAVRQRDYWHARCCAVEDRMDRLETELHRLNQLRLRALWDLDAGRTNKKVPDRG